MVNLNDSDDAHLLLQRKNLWRDTMSKELKKEIFAAVKEHVEHAMMGVNFADASVSVSAAIINSDLVQALAKTDPTIATLLTEWNKHLAAVIQAVHSIQDTVALEDAIAAVIDDKEQE